MASVKDLSELLSHEDYFKYNEKKQKIIAKYPEEMFPNYIEEGKIFYSKEGITEEQRILWNKYLKEICDLIFKPNGHYQKFSWDYLTPTHEKERMEAKAKGKMTPKIFY